MTTTKKKLSIRQESHAVRIYGVSKASDWLATPLEVAAELGLNIVTVREVAALKGWRLGNGRKGIENSGRFTDEPRPIYEEMR